MTETIPATFEVLDDRFRSVGGDFRVERLYGDCRWAEGPVYLPAARSLIVSPTSTYDSPPARALSRASA